MNFPDNGDYFVPAAALARAAGVHADMIKRRIYEGKLVPDAYIERGEDPKVPIFLASRLDEHIGKLIPSNRGRRTTEVLVR